MLFGVFLFLFFLTLLLEALCRLFLFVFLCYQSFCHSLNFMKYNILP